MLNNIIGLDLHIHSYASKYKEPTYENGESYVEHSTKENIGVLLGKLIERKITLFSITDHNRYDIDLYKTIINQLKLEKYQALKLLHGIEFDVKLDETKRPAHIIAIFNVQDEADMNNISSVLSKNMLMNKNDFYKKEIFETLLKKIGLETILIVHQRCSLERDNGKYNSLSESVSNPYEIIEIGYINALEYQKPNIEGILKDNLKKVTSDVALITGSDCHDWRYYPKHDMNSKENNDYFSKCKILPSFKGLLLGLSSSKTRFNRRDSVNSSYLKSFNINRKEIPLDSSINVIIGENGSGKSTLFNILSGSKLQPYIKTLQKENAIEINSGPDVNAIKQAELIEKFQKNELFQSEEYYDDVDTAAFENKYRDFNKQLKNNIEAKIRKNKTIQDLQQKNFKINLECEENTTLYVSATSDKLSEIENEHTKHRKQLNTILTALIEEYNDRYYNATLQKHLFEAIKHLKFVYDEVEKEENKVYLSNKVTNVIKAKINDYALDIEKLSTSKDQEIIDYQTNKSTFSEAICNAIKEKCIVEKLIEFPAKIVGESVKRYNGYVFTRETNYNNCDVREKFLEMMFVKEYRDIDKVQNIQNKEELKKAILSCTQVEKIDEVWTSNYNKFLSWAKEKRSYIKEESTDDSIGNTLGEMSLAYYKFQTSENQKWDVLMIDQPEDNISNYRIADKLITYFNRIRKNKQLILVTHNPLLVVNLDADNILYLKKVNNTINVTSGCLEDEENDILNIVASTLDGGKEMIEKRLKIYG